MDTSYELNNGNKKTATGDLGLASPGEVTVNGTGLTGFLIKAI